MDGLIAVAAEHRDASLAALMEKFTRKGHTGIAGSATSGPGPACATRVEAHPEYPWADSWSRRGVVGAGVVYRDRRCASGGVPGSEGRSRQCRAIEVRLTLVFRTVRCAAEGTAAQRLHRIGLAGVLARGKE